MQGVIGKFKEEQEKVFKRVQWLANHNDANDVGAEIDRWLEELTTMEEDFELEKPNTCPPDECESCT